MKAMPAGIKKKLRQINTLAIKQNELILEVTEQLEKYGIHLDDLSAMGNGEMHTEALTDIEYGTSAIESAIEELETVFLYYVNKKN